VRVRRFLSGHQRDPGCAGRELAALLERFFGA
jgi:hypothetical protein